MRILILLFTVGVVQAQVQRIDLDQITQADSTFVIKEGRIGIGTSSPQNALDVNGVIRAGILEYEPSSYATISTSRNGANYIEISGKGTGTAGTPAFSTIFSRGTHASPLVPEIGDRTFAIFNRVWDGVGYNVNPAAITFFVDHVDTTASPREVGASIHLETGRTTAGARNKVLTVTSSGNVGIGTTSPNYPTHVAASATNGDVTTARQLGIGVDNSPNYNLTLGYYFTGSAFAGVLQARDNGNGSPLLLNPSGGNVGIGTSPVSKFHVSDASSSITLRDYLNGATIFLDGSDGDFIGGDYFHIIANGNSYLGLGGYGGGTTPLNITNTGNVGIGTTSPNDKLDIFDTSDDTKGACLMLSNTGFLSNPGRIGSIRFRGGYYNTTVGEIFLGNDNNGYVWNGNVEDEDTYLAFSTANDQVLSEAMRITKNRNVGIGTTSPSYKLHVNGSVAGVGGYVNLSDIDYKKNIYDLTDGLDKVLQLRPVTFKWKNIDYGDRINTGFIAQEVELVLPDVVLNAQDGVKSLATTDLIPVLTKAIQELYTIIEQQQQTINELKATINE
jgi:hypothetical protein